MCVQHGVATVKLLIADHYYCKLLGSIPIHLPHPRTIALAFCVPFVSLPIHPYPHRCSWAAAVPSVPMSSPNSPLGPTALAGAEPRVASSAKGVRMTYPFIHATSPSTVGLKSHFGFRTQQRLIVWVLARKMYSRQMWCSNGFSRSMLCICRYITGPSPLCCNCCFQKLMRQKC